MKRSVFLAFISWLMIVGTSSFAVGEVNLGLVASNPMSREAIIQIYGRLCEYHREDVEAALHASRTVRQVEFLNGHGTVLLRYQPGSETPEQLARAVERALAGGWNCTVRVDQGKPTIATRQQEERP